MDDDLGQARDGLRKLLIALLD
jgi:hypothetical protein